MPNFNFNLLLKNVVFDGSYLFTENGVIKKPFKFTEKILIFTDFFIVPIPSLYFFFKSRSFEEVSII